MTYMLLIYATERCWSEEEHKACKVESMRISKEMEKQGKWISASPLHSVTTATSLRVREGSLAQLTKGSSVTVNTVMPGSTLTPGVKEFVSNLFPDQPYDSAEKRFMADNRPTSLIQRLIQPEEIANTVAFVAGPLASAINEAPIRVDGGLNPTIV